MNGLYIVFEGIVGSGKTTQSKRLFQYLKKKLPYKEIIWTREPGGSEIADHIRKVVQGKTYNEKMCAICEAYLYAASRAQTLNTIVKPVLDQGGIVISDRSFISSVAFQGYGRGLGIKKVLEINRLCVGETVPDKIVYLNLNPEIGLKRSFDKEGDKFEKEFIDFFKKVEKGYKELSKLAQFKPKWINIDGKGDINTVFNRIIEKISPFLI